MMHVGMNIPDKDQLFREASRVLKKGSSFGIYDVMLTGEKPLSYPVPWAENTNSCFIAKPEEYLQALRDAGFEIMNTAISDTAEYGGITRGRRVINEDVETIMKNTLEEIQSGEFHVEWKKEHEKGYPLLKKLRKELLNNALEGPIGSEPSIIITSYLCFLSLKTTSLLLMSKLVIVVFR